MSLRSLILFSCLLLASSVIQADNLTIHPFVKGSFATLKSQRLNKPFVLMFWSESCTYCMKEMAMFGKLQQRFPEVELVTVATDPFLEESTVIDVLSRSQLNLQQTWVFAEQFPEIIYAEINKRWRGELPATHFFSRDNQETRHMGIVKEDELLAWMQQQVAK